MLVCVCVRERCLEVCKVCLFEQCVCVCVRSEVQVPRQAHTRTTEGHLGTDRAPDVRTRPELSLRTNNTFHAENLGSELQK